MKIYCLLIFTFSVLSVFATEEQGFERKVYDAVMYQMETYPKSTLKDLYKNFFQDRFGPGHIISDTAVANRYLRHELTYSPTLEGKIAETVGWEQNFYRVNLSVIRDSIIPFSHFIDALMRSANEITPVTIEEWKKEWQQIEAIIRSMNLSLPDYEKDYTEIEDLLNNGLYIGHHSKSFNEAYAPHYRIISKKIFEEELLPLIKEHKK